MPVVPDSPLSGVSMTEDGSTSEFGPCWSRSDRWSLDKKPAKSNRYRDSGSALSRDDRLGSVRV